MNNMNFYFLAPTQLKNRDGAKTDPKKHPTSKISMANIPIREI